MRRIIFVFILCFSSASFADSTTENKQALIDELFTQMGQSATETGKLFSNLFIDQMTNSLKKAKPDVDPRAYDIIREEVNLIMEEEFFNNKTLANLMYPIYGERFSEDELKALIAFNKTPLGKKLIKEMPSITQEGMAAGQKFGEALGPEISQRIERRLEAEGIDK